MRQVNFHVVFTDDAGEVINPPAWSRARVNTRQTKDGKSFPVFFESKKEVAARYQINAAAVKAGLQVDDTTPGVVLTFLVVKQRTKTRPKHVPLAMWKAGGRLPCPVKPDKDNHEKIILDGIGASGLKAELSFPCWRDDAVVVGAQGWKAYGAEGEMPHLEVWVREVTFEDWPFKVRV